MPSVSDRNYHLLRQFDPLVSDFAGRCRGTILDIGCGTKPYEGWLTDDTSYLGMDLQREGKNVDLLGDGTTIPVKSASIDSIIATQVLEHVPEPYSFFNEVSRVLKTGGTALITTNQMYPLHEVPHDYFRFTRYGLRQLAADAGLSIENVIELGTLPMRACSEANYALSGNLPSPVDSAVIGLVNLLAFPIVHLNHREEYIVTGVEVKKPE